MRLLQIRVGSLYHQWIHSIDKYRSKGIGGSSLLADSERPTVWWNPGSCLLPASRIGRELARRIAGFFLRVGAVGIQWVCINKKSLEKISRLFCSNLEPRAGSERRNPGVLLLLQE